MFAWFKKSVIPPVINEKELTIVERLQIEKQKVITNYTDLVYSNIKERLLEIAQNTSDPKFDQTSFEIKTGDGIWTEVVKNVVKRLKEQDKLKASTNESCYYIFIEW